MLKFIICALIFGILTSGCATLKEGAKCVAGVSTKILEDNRKTAVTKTVNHDYFTAYTKSIEILKRAGSYIYVQDIKKHMIAVYFSESDTTPIGVFFKEIGANTTEMQVSSPSSYAKEVIAGRLFSVLKN